MEVGDRVLCQHRNIIRVDKLRNSVVHLRVYMVRASGKDDPAVAGLIQVSDGLFALLLHVFPAGGKLGPCSMYGGLDLGSRDGERI